MVTVILEFIAESTEKDTQILNWINRLIYSLTISHIFLGEFVFRTYVYVMYILLSVIHMDKMWSKMLIGTWTRYILTQCSF